MMRSVLFLAAIPLFAQPDRLFAPIDTRSMVVMKGGVNFRVAAAQDLGPLPASQKMSGMRLFIAMTAAQKADQKERSDPGLPNYHQWLTPEQSEERFGLSA